MDFPQQEQNCTDWELTIHENVVQYNKGLKSAFAQHFVFTYQNLEKFRSPLVPPSCRSIGRKKPVFMGILIGEVCGLQNRHSPVQIWSSPPRRRSLRTAQKTQSLPAAGFSSAVLRVSSFPHRSALRWDPRLSRSQSGRESFLCP